MNSMTAFGLLLVCAAVYLLMKQRRVSQNPFTYSVTARKTVAADLSGIGGFSPRDAKKADAKAENSCGCLL